MKKVPILIAAVIAFSSCSSSGDKSNNDYSPTRNEAAFKSAVARTCTRLGIAFTQTDVNFLLEELAGAISQTGYSNSEAIGELNAQCPNNVAYANALG
jgi:hypothetical protein